MSRSEANFPEYKRDHDTDGRHVVEIVFRDMIPYVCRGVSFGAFFTFRVTVCHFVKSLVSGGNQERETKTQNPTLFLYVKNSVQQCSFTGEGAEVSRAASTAPIATARELVARDASASLGQ